MLQYLKDARFLTTLKSKRITWVSPINYSLGIKVEEDKIKQYILKDDGYWQCNGDEISHFVFIKEVLDIDYHNQAHDQLYDLEIEHNRLSYWDLVDKWIYENKSIKHFDLMVGFADGLSLEGLTWEL